MKFLFSQLMYFVQDRSSRRNLRALFYFFVILIVLVTVHTVVFHFLMLREGQDHSWISGIYWTLVTMSTLGFGDIIFSSDLGRLFSIWVILSGIIFLLVLLPFTFIEFFYAPWIAAQSAARAPRELPEHTHGHVVLTHDDPVIRALITRLERYYYDYVLLVPDLDEALRMYDQGFRVMVGEIDDPETYRRARIHQAAMVVTTATDAVNTNVTFTVREMVEMLPIVATAYEPDSVDILELAGSSHVLQLSEMLGQSLARRINVGNAQAHVIGQFEELLIAEASPAGTSLVNHTLQESRLREQVGVSVIGVWERGHFQSARGDTRIYQNTILVLAGSRTQLNAYNARYSTHTAAKGPVVIIGGGRVGRAIGHALSEWKMDYRIVEIDPDHIRDPEIYVQGNAADRKVLDEAGLSEAPAVVITTRDDDTNIYLTIYCRRLRPNIEIISRATQEKNVSTLHRAGADFVMSYASMGASTLFNYLKRSDILMVAEGLDVFRMQVPPGLVGKTIAEAGIRQKTGCSVIAVIADGKMQVNPDPAKSLFARSEIILIGSVEAENQFLQKYGA